MVRNHFTKTLAVCACLVAAASTAAAQDTTQAQTQPPPAAPQRHVVQVGETLWGLAQLYLGDPFLWPDIYRLNTAVVEDPHWIFPGEELLLAPADHTQAAAPVVHDTLAVEQEAARRPVEMVELPAAEPVAPPPSPSAPTVFGRAPEQQALEAVPAGPREHYRGVRPGDFYAAPFLTEGRKLPWGAVEGLADVGTARGSSSATAMIYQDIRLRAPSGAAYQVGDSLLTVRRGDDVGGDWGRVVEPTGLVRVVSAAGPDAVARIIEQFDQIHAGQSVLPIEPFPRVAAGPPQPVTDGVEGLMIGRPEDKPVPNLHDAVFVDLGRNASLVPGDVFELLPTEEMAGSPEGPQPLAQAEVLRVGDRSCTIAIRRIFTPGIRVAGRKDAHVPVRLISKMPS